MRKSRPANILGSERLMEQLDSSINKPQNANTCTRESKIMFKENKTYEWLEWKIMFKENIRINIRMVKFKIRCWQIYGCEKYNKEKGRYRK